MSNQVEEHRNGFYAPTFRDSDFRTVMRLPRHGHRPPRLLRRHPQAVRIQMVDTVSPALALGCLVVLAAVISVMAFAVVVLAGEAVHVLSSSWRAIHS